MQVFIYKMCKKKKGRMQLKSVFFSKLKNILKFISDSLMKYMNHNFRLFFGKYLIVFLRAFRLNIV